MGLLIALHKHSALLNQSRLCRLASLVEMSVQKKQLEGQILRPWQTMPTRTIVGEPPGSIACYSPATRSGSWVGLGLFSLPLFSLPLFSLPLERKVKQWQLVTSSQKVLSNNCRQSPCISKITCYCFSITLHS
jgi:hypothetical protein